jgi:hypothetical protein
MPDKDIPNATIEIARYATNPTDKAPPMIPLHYTRFSTNFPDEDVSWGLVKGL